ncbi:MAG: hypothetical protein PSN34_14105 [Urechidicola sp.]|nr:hypothetical protein [Urechidicola sp.]
MIYYQAICRNHNFKSNLYVDRFRAVQSASSHRSRTSGSHNLKILKVYIPSSSIKVRSESAL